MGKIRNLLFMLLGIVVWYACTDDNEQGGSKPIAAGTYSSDLLLATEQGGGSQVSTRGLNKVDGYFTSDYPYDYIYIHSADDDTESEGHKFLRIPLQDVVFCDGCQGIHLEMEVHDEASGGGYTITNKAGGSITLAEDESVYFSTISSSYWQAKVESASPVTGSDVFIQDNDVNAELLRSVNTYTKEDLVALLSEAEPEIPMGRHCTAFRVYFMFTDFDMFGGNLTTVAGWNSVWNSMLGGSGGDAYSPEHFYIKLYLGPNFTSEYNVYRDDVTDVDAKGFYVTNEQQYAPFELSTFTAESGTSGSVAYGGYGYLTDYSNYLIAPLNTHLSADDFSLYVFVKYAEDPNQVSDDFLTSDEGAKWFQLQVPSMTLQTNRVHFIVLQVDMKNLDVFAQGQTTDTRAITGLEEIKVENYKVLNIE